MIAVGCWLRSRGELRIQPVVRPLLRGLGSRSLAFARSGTPTPLRAGAGLVAPGFMIRNTAHHLVAIQHADRKAWKHADVIVER